MFNHEQRLQSFWRRPGDGVENYLSLFLSLNEAVASIERHFPSYPGQTGGRAGGNAFEAS